MPASPYAYPVHQVLPADVPLPQPVGEAGLANAAVMMQPSCLEVIAWIAEPFLQTSGAVGNECSGVFKRRQLAMALSALAKTFLYKFKQNWKLESCGFVAKNA